jgi:hypothetical protein
MWPTTICVNYRRSRHVLDVTDAFFGFAVLVMGTDSAEGKTLIVFTDVLLADVVGKSAVVSMVMLYTDAKGTGILFKFSFGFQCVSQVSSRLKMNIG